MKVIIVTDKSKTWGDKVIDHDLDDALIEPILHFLWHLQCREGMTYVQMNTERPPWYIQKQWEAMGEK